MLNLPRQRGRARNLYGPLFGLPEWARKLGPFAHSPAVSLPNPDFVGGWVMAAIAVAFVVAAVLLFRRRDTVPGE